MHQRNEQTMSKHRKRSHQHREQPSFAAGHPRCPCGNPTCEVMEIVRLIAETTDNFLLLQETLHIIKRHLLPLLDQMHHDQQTSLERWQIEQDIYRSQMVASARPTRHWQPFSPLEEEFSRRTQWVGEWYHREQQ